MTTVLKLGGSVVTEKSSPETLDASAIERAARAIADGPDDLVLVHGGGSFGHHHASEHGVTTTTGTTDAAAVADIHGAMHRLNDAIVDRLLTEGVQAVPVRPLSCASRDESGDLTLFRPAIERLRAAGFVPVLHGDVIAHDGQGATILSGDELVAELAVALDADRVGLCSAVPGVLDADDEVIPRIEAFDAVADVFDATAGTDVTGGMAGKVRTLLPLPAPASIFGLDELSSFLAGERPGSTVDGSAHDRS